MVPEGSDSYFKTSDERVQVLLALYRLYHNGKVSEDIIPKLENMKIIDEDPVEYHRGFVLHPDVHVATEIVFYPNYVMEHPTGEIQNAAKFLKENKITKKEMNAARRSVSKITKYNFLDELEKLGPPVSDFRKDYEKIVFAATGKIPIEEIKKSKRTAMYHS